MTSYNYDLANREKAHVTITLDCKDLTALEGVYKVLSTVCLDLLAVRESIGYARQILDVMEDVAKVIEKAKEEPTLAEMIEGDANE